ncbi:MAG: hypothetical protein ABI210_04145, partial [Abditibacteriaceae bacterium]
MSSKSLIPTLAALLLTTCAGVAQTTAPGAVAPSDSVKPPSATAPDDSIKLQSAPARSKIGDYIFSGSLRVRLQNWDWFGTPGFNDSYTFGESLLRFGVSRSQSNLDQELELAVPALIGLPNNAVGLGASYKAANGGQDASIFPKQAFLRFKNIGASGNSLRVGRFEYGDGSEVTPKNPTLAALKSSRINERLLGSFGFSVVGRSFDGVQLMRDTPNGNLNLMAIRPTEGLFQLNGLDEVNGVNV